MIRRQQSLKLPSKKSVEKDVVFSSQLVTRSASNSGEKPMNFTLACHWRDVVHF